jgi:hypothetical protein
VSRKKSREKKRRKPAPRRRQGPPPNPRERASLWTVLVRAAAVLVATAAVLFGGRALRLELPVALRDASQSALPPLFRHQMQIVLRSLPPGAAVLHLSSIEENWYSRMWERALYPRHAVVSLQPPGLDPARIRRASEAFGTRFAISVGDPSPGAGYRWTAPLGRLPGLEQESWFGELNP